jgi:hypothetical protein
MFVWVLLHFHCSTVYIFYRLSVLPIAWLGSCHDEFEEKKPYYTWTLYVEAYHMHYDVPCYLISMTRKRPE